MNLATELLIKSLRPGIFCLLFVRYHRVCPHQILLRLLDLLTTLHFAFAVLQVLPLLLTLALVVFASVMLVDAEQHRGGTSGRDKMVEAKPDVAYPQSMDDKEVLKRLLDEKQRRLKPQQHCVADHITTVDHLGKVGVEADITIGSDDLPLVAYYDFTNRRLKTLHCDNLECTNSTHTIVGYTTGDVGYRPSIALNPATGYAMITYYDNANRDLEVASCENIACPFYFFELLI